MTAAVRGAWTLGTADTEAAHEILLDDLRNHELSPVTDGVVIELVSVLLNEWARVDGVQVEKDFMNSLVREAGFRERSVFDTYDYGYAPPEWMMSSPELW